MARLVVISDTHAHPWSAFSTGDGADNDRLLRTLDVKRASLDRARDLACPWVHAGDMVHTTGHAKHPVASAVIALLREYPDVPKVVVGGNHDSRGRGGRVSLEESFQAILADAVPNLTVLRPGTSFECDDGTTLVGDFAHPRDTDIDLDQDGDVGVFHAMVTGATFPSGPEARGLDPDALLSRFTLSIVGDIHKPHVHREGDRMVLIPGAPEHHNFGDEPENRGWWVVDVVPGEVRDVEFVPSGSPKFLTVETADDVRDDGNFYRVRSGGGTLPENAKAIAPDAETIPVRDLLEGARDRREVLARWQELRPPERWPRHHAQAGAQLMSGQDVLSPVDGRIRRVILRNFGSYAAADLSVGRGVHLVLGRGADHPSNGAGKSTVAGEAAYWCLFGKTTKGVGADEVARRESCGGDGSVEVTVEIDLPDDRDLVVTRSRKGRDHSLVIRVDGEEIPGDTLADLQSKLEALIGYTPELYRALGYFSQEDVVLLATKTDAQVKDLAADLLDLRAYQAAYDRAGEIMREKAKEAEAARSRAVAEGEIVAEATTNREGLEEKAAEWEAAHVQELEALRQELEDARAGVESVREEWDARVVAADQETEAARERADARTEAVWERGDEVIVLIDAAVEPRVERRTRELTEEASSEIRTQLRDVRSRMEGLEGPVTDVDPEDVRSRVAAARDRLTNARDRLNGLRRTIRDAGRERDALLDKAREAKRIREAAEAGECHACGQPLPDATDDLARAESLREEAARGIASLDARVADAEAALPEAEAEVSSLESAIAKGEDLAYRAKEWAEAAEREEVLTEKMSLVEDAARERARREVEAVATARRQKVRDFVAAVGREGERAVATLKQAAAQERQLAETAVRDAETAVRDAEREVRTAEAATNPHASAVEQAEARELRARRARWRAHLTARRAERERDVHSYWRDAFGKSGIQSLLMDDLAAEFNRVRGEVMPLITRGVYDVQFSTTSTTRSGEEREKVEFVVHKHGERVPYASLSGGERRRVDLGVLFTFVLAASRAYGAPAALGSLVLDEVAGYMDEGGAEALSEALDAFVPDTVPTAFVVSQNRDLQALFDSTIMVKQGDDGVSRLLGAGE